MRYRAIQLKRSYFQISGKELFPKLFSETYCLLSVSQMPSQQEEQIQMEDPDPVRFPANLSSQDYGYPAQGISRKQLLPGIR